MLFSRVAKLHDLHEPGGYEIAQAVGVLTPPLPARLQLGGNDIHHHQPIGQCPNDFRAATCCVQANDDTGIGNNEHGRVSQAGQGPVSASPPSIS